jgi:hypothetical protein
LQRNDACGIINPLIESVERILHIWGDFFDVVTMLVVFEYIEPDKDEQVQNMQ